MIHQRDRRVCWQVREGEVRVQPIQIEAGEDDGLDPVRGIEDGGGEMHRGFADNTPDRDVAGHKAARLQNAPEEEAIAEVD